MQNESVHKEVVIIGYSGHSYVVIDSFLSQNCSILGYCDQEKKSSNPYGLEFLGQEDVSLLSSQNWFVAIGDIGIRKKVIDQFKEVGNLVIARHASAVVSQKANIGRGSLLSANTTIQSMASIGIGCIINTGAIVEHECSIGDFSHIAPGAVLAGNVEVGQGSFIGANAVVKEGTIIGANVVIGAGSVVIDDIPDNVTVVGNPGKIIR